MSEQQLLVFTLEGGLEGGCTRNPAALAAVTDRLKQLLHVRLPQALGVGKREWKKCSQMLIKIT